MKDRDMKTTKKFVCSSKGSALIMTIVLTVLLAAVAVMFVAVARMDRAATSNIIDSKMLDTAAESILAIINKELVYDTPGVAKIAKLDPNKYPQYFEYKDYPDPCDRWLASSEPNCDPNKISDENAYRWRQISDVTGYLKAHNFPTRNIKVKPVGYSSATDVIREYPLFDVNENGVFYKSTGGIALEGISADADGDGIADSKWFELSNLRMPTGRVFAAVRIIDNGAMANVNTAYKLDPAALDANEIDGSSQMHINLAGLLKTPDTISNLHNARKGTRTVDDANFHNDVICDFNNIPPQGYLPFDWSDELELRYRYCIDSKFKSRLERADILYNTLDGPADGNNLYDAGTGWGIRDWARRIIDVNFPVIASEAYRRHLLTTYNCDRLIDPNGDQMLNINEANAMSLYKLFKKYTDPNLAGQIAANLVDFRDNDSKITIFRPDSNNTFYGFEKPCIYISEIVYKQVRKTSPVPPTVMVYKSYAIELYRPYNGDSNDIWWVYVNKKAYPVTWLGSSAYHVIRMQDPEAPLIVDAGISLDNITYEPPFFSDGDIISLVRVTAKDKKKLLVDVRQVTPGFIPTTDETITRSRERDITKAKYFRHLWQPAADDSHTLGKTNDYQSTDPVGVQAYPADKHFVSVGEIGMVLRKSAYSLFDANNPFGASFGIPIISPVSVIDSGIKVNIADANFSHIFNYLTAVDSRRENQTRVKGRININTAPAKVIAQLPWVSQRPDGVVDVNLAQAIVAYRDSNDVNGFKNIGQLMNVPGMNRYATDSNDLKTFPDLTPNDEAINDYEERDVIFARMSNLATVRSDVFTAYILVRVGVNGPQKRYVAILDRSEVKKPTDKVKIRAFQNVPDAR